MRNDHNLQTNRLKKDLRFQVTSLHGKIEWHSSAYEYIKRVLLRCIHHLSLIYFIVGTLRKIKN